MSRMIDDMNARGFMAYSWTERAPVRGGQELTDTILRSEIFNIDNVAEYYHFSNPGRRWQLNDFPNLAPPYPATWLEFRCSQRLRDSVRETAIVEARQLGLTDEEREAAVADVGRAVGVHLSYDEVPQDAPIPLAYGLPHGWHTNAPQTFAAGSIRWILRIMVFLQDVKGNAPAFCAFLQTGVQANGALHADHLFCGKLLVPTEGSRVPAINGMNVEDSRIIAIMQMFGFPALLAVSFMHCRNVSIETEPVSPKFVKAFRRRNDGREPVTFKTLRIEPVKRILREAGAEDAATGLKRALHIARGHFKHFGEEYGTKPLFGKHRGAYFWHDALRGSSKAGAVVKDYDVRSPKQEG